MSRFPIRYVAQRVARCLLAVCLGLFASDAWAGKAKPVAEKEKAKHAYEEATKSYNLGEYQAALEHFKAAYRAYQEPSFLFNMAQCYRQLGQKADAVRSYRAFLRNAKGDQSEAEQLVASLERALAEELAAKQRPPSGVIAPGSEADTPLDRPSAEKVSSVAAKKPFETIGSPEIARPPVASPAKPKRLYQKGWFWGVLGSVVVAGAAVGVGLALAPRDPRYPAGDPAAATIHF